MAEYHVPVAPGGVADIFDQLESNKNALQIKHFSVSQTTLDEVRKRERTRQDINRDRGTSSVRFCRGGQIETRDRKKGQEMREKRREEGRGSRDTRKLSGSERLRVRKFKRGRGKLTEGMPEGK